MDEFAKGLRNFFDDVFHVEWLGTVVTIVVVIVCTIIVASLATRLLRRFLNRDNGPLPASSIFINITRVAIWAIGISIILSSCFGIDVSAAITALGIGGIAISLGFQDTLSNLISGVEVSVTGLVKPGDYISVDGQTGIVRDVTWRHTAIENSVGESIAIPNATINTKALTHLRPRTVITVPIVETVSGEHLGETANKIAEAATSAVEKVDKVTTPAKALFTEVTDYGYKGTLTVSITSDEKAAEAKNAVLQAIAPYMH